MAQRISHINENTHVTELKLGMDKEHCPSNVPISAKKKEKKGEKKGGGLWQVSGAMSLTPPISPENNDNSHGQSVKYVCSTICTFLRSSTCPNQYFFVGHM